MSRLLCRQHSLLTKHGQKVSLTKTRIASSLLITVYTVFAATLAVIFFLPTTNLYIGWALGNILSFLFTKHKFPRLYRAETEPATPLEAAFAAKQADNAICPRCRGQATILCEGCRGRGSSKPDWSDDDIECSRCVGTGRISCPRCNGDGLVIE